MPNTDELKSRLTKLGFNYLADNFADFCSQNQKKNRSIYEIIEQIASLETEEFQFRGQIGAATVAASFGVSLAQTLGAFELLANMTGIGRKKSIAKRSKI